MSAAEPTLLDSSENDTQVQIAEVGGIRQPVNPPHITAFFDRLYEPLRELARSIGVDERFVLAQAAYESGWFRDQPEKGNYSASKNAVFGFSNKEVPLIYPSREESIGAWKRVWGPRVQQSQTMNEFIDKLQNPPIDPRTGKSAYDRYNSKNPNYAPQLQGMFRTIERRLPIWKLEQNLKRP